MAISLNPKEILSAIDQHFALKERVYKPPDVYLGATISQFHLPDNPEKVRWAMGSEQYVKEAVHNVENWLKQRDAKLKTKATTPLPSGYRPELDVSPHVDQELYSYYNSLIGIARWAVELGRIDITTEVSMLASFLAAPREGHLDAAFHLFAYLKSHKRSRIVFDDSFMSESNTSFPEFDWVPFYADAREEIPPNMPEPLGKPVHITIFCDSDHAADKVTRRSRTGLLIFINRAPIDWSSKRQNSIETSTFGSEFTALKHATEKAKGLRYKLRMMGVHVDGPATIRCDNMSVVNNTTAPESTLKKKSNSIAYHFCREAVAAGIIRVAYENTLTNLADVLTKCQPATIRQRLIAFFMY